MTDLIRRLGPAAKVAQFFLGSRFNNCGLGAGFRTWRTTSERGGGGDPLLATAIRKASL